MIQRMMLLHVFLIATSIRQFSFKTVVALPIKINYTPQWKISPTLSSVQNKRRGPGGNYSIKITLSSNSFRRAYE